MSQIAFDPFDRVTRRDPYPVYARLRDEEPVHRIEGLGLAVVSRYDDARAVLQDSGSFSSRAMRDLFSKSAKTVMEDAELDGETLIGSDPPVHTRLRKIVNRAFTPSRIAALEPRVREITSELVSRFAGRGECELLSDFAIPLPVTIIAEILGVDPARREEFKRWSDDLLLAGTGRPTPEQAERIRISDEHLGAWVDEVVEARRGEPREDLISALVAAEASEEVMTSEEIGNLILILLIAGNETTTNLIANAMLALLAHPEELARVAREPDLIPGAVEEVLRYDSPVQLTLRRALRDIELPGGKLAQGETVAVLLGSANRDERRFPAPARFDVRRDCRGHLAFGLGTHFCVGAGLARLEARVALEALLDLRGWSRTEEPLEYGSSIIVRCLERLPLRFSG